MEVFNPTKDLAYFQSIWEYKKRDVCHTKEVWDDRAGDWGKELELEGPFRFSLQERVGKAADYLRSKGLLGHTCRVVDIGCGPGHFVGEFAKTSAHVTGVDLSPRMLEIGAAYGRELGLNNVSFVSGDFGELDIDALGWRGKFDLVFTSITPAIGTISNLEKAMEMSRGYCFNSCFIHWEDNLEQQIGEDLFGRDSAHNNHSHWFYALFNMLWTQGYFPETHYHKQQQTDAVPVHMDLAKYYAKCFATDLLAHEPDVSRILEYLQDRALPNGTIERQYERIYGWILWDVRKRGQRLPI